MDINPVLMGLLFGPMIGFLVGLEATNLHKRNGSRAKLEAAIVGWFASGLLGLIPSAIFQNQGYIVLVGIQIPSIIFGAWIASVFGAISGIITAAVMGCQSKQSAIVATNDDTQDKAT